MILVTIISCAIMIILVSHAEISSLRKLVLSVLIVITTAIVCVKIYLWRRSYLRISSLLPHLNQHDAILDVGAGDGCLTKALQNLGYNAVALDVVDAGTCTKSTIFDGEHIPFEDKSYDVAIVSFVLHHVKDQDAMLRELRRVSKKVLVFEDIPHNHTIDKYLTQLHSHSSWGHNNKGFHMEAAWRQKFSEHGFNTISTKSIPRFYYPFSDKPLIYPIHRSFFVLV